MIVKKNLKTVNMISAQTGKVRTPATLTPFEFTDAERKVSQLLIGLCSPSGQGKTVGALRLATGLACGKPIALIDSENGRALINAPAPGESPKSPYTFAFKHLNFPPPFTPQRYAMAAKAAARLHPGVIIFDSMWHEWMGAGGMCEVADIEGEGNFFRGLKNPRKHHTQFMNVITSLPCHIIMCARAKEKFQQVRAGGKWDVVSTGYHPQCETGLPYDMTINLLLEKGIPAPDDLFDEFKMPGVMEMVSIMIPRDKQLSEETGAALAAWCMPQKAWEEYDNEEKEVEAVTVPEETTKDDQEVPETTEQT